NVGVYQPFVGPPVEWEYNQDELALLYTDIQRIILRAEDPKAEPQAHPKVCAYCVKLAHCKAVEKAVIPPLAQYPAMQELTTYDPVGATPDQLAIGLEIRDLMTSWGGAWYNY